MIKVNLRIKKENSILLFEIQKKKSLLNLLVGALLLENKTAIPGYGAFVRGILTNPLGEPTEDVIELF